MRLIEGKNDLTLKTTESLRVGRKPSVFRTTMGKNDGGGGAYFVGALSVVIGVPIAGPPSESGRP